MADRGGDRLAEPVSPGVMCPFLMRMCLAADVMVHGPTASTMTVRGDCILEVMIAVLKGVMVACIADECHLLLVSLLVFLTVAA